MKEKLDERDKHALANRVAKLMGKPTAAANGTRRSPTPF
jgi:hypothetical protein